MKFEKAVRGSKNARIFLRGTSGSGKTYSALVLAKNLGKKILLIDTESESSTHYADGRIDGLHFDILKWEKNFDNHWFGYYIEAIDEAEKEGYDVIIVDSFSHAWTGKMGVLEMNELFADKNFKGNTFRAWNKTNDEVYYPLINKILMGNNVHIIATGRTKTEYEVGKDDTGKTTVQKLGTKTVARDGIEYEFDTILDLQDKRDGFGYKDKDRTGIFPFEGQQINDELGKKYSKYYKKVK